MASAISEPETPPASSVMKNVPICSANTNIIKNAATEKRKTAFVATRLVFSLALNILKELYSLMMILTATGIPEVEILKNKL